MNGTKNISNVIVNHVERSEVVNDVIKVVFIISLMLGCAGVLGAQDNSSEKLLKKAPNGNEWTSQILYDTVNACYQGTVKWIIMTNPQLIGTVPPPMVQRKMLVHCFCVLDKIRNEYPLSKYIERVFDGEWTGNLFMTKALECVNNEGTLGGILEILPTDNETKTDNKTIIVPELKQEDSNESLPDQTQEEESDTGSEPIFQG